MTVYLVGAGPGDPGLITVRGAELLGRADVVVHDRLSARALLELAPATATRIDVGKRPGQSAAQHDINERLIELGRSHACVVRLKGGDPFVFARGGEEALALEEAGVDYEVGPGLSARFHFQVSSASERSPRRYISLTWPRCMAAFWSSKMAIAVSMRRKPSFV